MVARNVAGTMNILQAASKTETVKRVVLTSSVNAALIQKPNEKRVVDESMYRLTNKIRRMIQRRNRY